MATPTESTQGLLRARRTAACARATIGAGGIVLSLTWPRPGVITGVAALGFIIILLTAAIEFRLPSPRWLAFEETLAPVAALLVVGLGPERITGVGLLWMSSAACGVLARGGRQHWLGRAIMLIALVLPIALHRAAANYWMFCVATIALLLTCGRVTRELRTLLRQARHDADHDGLTGALSRSAFNAALDEALRDGRATVPTALLLLDLDGFGQVNKSAGHAAGDALLVTVARRIAAAVAETGFCGRLGGDEFAAVMPAVDAEPLAQEIVERLADSADGPAIRASAGIALAPSDGEDADALLRAADVALRVAKRSGGRRVSVYAGESMSDRGPGGAREALERLIAGQGLEIVVQPIVEIPSGVVHAHEALARFRTRENSGPLHWFALADELGVRDRLELACVREALRVHARRPAGTLLSLNLSAPLLLDERLHEQLDAGAPLDGLIIEVTEHSLLSDTPGMHAVIEGLQARGVRFAVDDVGAGYSGLRQITVIGPSYLKLDRSLISGIDLDPGRGALVAAMAGYALKTGGHLIAEGVETTAELEALLALGVPLVQGFLFARPARPWPTVTPLPGLAPAAPEVPALDALA